MCCELQLIFSPDSLCMFKAAHAAKADIVVWPSAFEGTGFLQAYSRLYSYYIIPAIPVPMAPKPFDFLGLTGLDSKNVNLIHSRTDLDLPNAVVWEIHINSRLICKANKQLEQLVYRLQKTHQVQLDSDLRVIAHCMLLALETASLRGFFVLHRSGPVTTTLF